MSNHSAKAGLAWVALASMVLWSGAAGAVVCVKAADDAYMQVTTNGSATVECWDAGDQPNPGQLPVSEGGPGTFNDGYLNLPAEITALAAKSDGVNADFFNIVSGSLTSGLSGSFTMDQGGTVALLFKSGGGQNTPSWWLYRFTNLVVGEQINWWIKGAPPVNGLSHVSAYVPIPAAAWLMLSGLVGLIAVGRRRSSASTPAAA